MGLDARTITDVKPSITARLTSMAAPVNPAVASATGPASTGGPAVADGALTSEPDMLSGARPG